MLSKNYEIASVASLLAMTLRTVSQGGGFRLEALTLSFPFDVFWHLFVLMRQGNLSGIDAASGATTLHVNRSIEHQGCDRGGKSCPWRHPAHDVGSVGHLFPFLCPSRYFQAGGKGSFISIIGMAPQSCNVRS